MSVRFTLAVYYDGGVTLGNDSGQLWCTDYHDKGRRDGKWVAVDSSHFAFMPECRAWVFDSVEEATEFFNDYAEDA
jgi:hypothetical protein